MDVTRGGFAPGRTVGTYRLERLLGGGGMGAVFLAYDTRLHRQVALKVIDSDVDDAQSSTRLLREARNAAALNHPHICTIYEVGEEQGAAFIAMEYVAGRSLRDRIDEGALPSGDVVRLGIQAADALAYAHEHGVVHRDFKAANVIVTAGGSLKVVDFGLARRDDVGLGEATTIASLVPAGALAGTPYSMAPEQVRAEAADARSDVWALGVLLYELVTGARPFTGQTVAELYSSILTGPPATIPSAVPAGMRVLIERCLEKDQARRYQRAGDVRAALDALAAGTVAPWVTWGYHVRRHPILVSSGMLAAIVALLVGFNVGSVRDRLMGVPSNEMPIKLAVLPFQNLTGDPEQEYFSDGLTDEMISQLGRLHRERLSVIARTSSMRYKRRELPIDQIGRELGVDYVLEGSARREGAQVRVTATLIHVRTQAQRWTNSFERELAGILALQNDVARGVAESLALTLLPGEQRRLARVRPVNVEAYEAYLRGFNLEANPTPANLTNALGYFELARNRDPTFAPAYADYLAIVNRHEDAVAQIQRAIELDPVSSQTQAFYGRVLMFVRRYAESIDQYRATLRTTPDQQVALANIRIALHLGGRFDEAFAADQIWAASNRRGGAEIADALTRGFREGGYRAAMHRAAEAMAARSGNPVIVAQFYVRAGETDSALDWLEAASREEACQPYLNAGPIWDSLRGSARFKALLRQMNLER